MSSNQELYDLRWENSMKGRDRYRVTGHYELTKSTLCEIARIKRQAIHESFTYKYIQQCSNCNMLVCLVSNRPI